jgi:chromosome segregation ATPase
LTEKREALKAAEESKLKFETEELEVKKKKYEDGLGKLVELEKEEEEAKNAEDKGKTNVKDAKENLKNAKEEIQKLKGELKQMGKAIQNVYYTGMSREG